jgi:hypothetical protein
MNWQGSDIYQLQMATSKQSLTNFAISHQPNASYKDLFRMWESARAKLVLNWTAPDSFQFPEKCEVNWQSERQGASHRWLQGFADG